MCPCRAVLVEVVEHWKSFSIYRILIRLGVLSLDRRRKQVRGGGRYVLASSDSEVLERVGVSGVCASPGQHTRPEQSMTRRIERPPTPTIPPLPVPTTTPFDQFSML